MPSPLNSPTSENIPRSLYDAFADIDILEGGKRNGSDSLNIISPFHAEATCCSPISTTSGSNSSCSIHHDHETEYSCESLDKSSSVDSTEVSTISVLPARSNLGSIRYRRAKLNLNLLPLSIGICSAPDIVSTTTIHNGEGANHEDHNKKSCERQISSQNELQLPINSRKNRGLMNFYLNKSLNFIDAVQIDTAIPLELQRWFHGCISRTDAEIMLESHGRVGAYLVRICDPRTRSYSISLKSFRGFMHIRVKKNEGNELYSLCQNRSSPDQFESVPELIQHYTCNRLPISGAEFMSFVFPIEAQLL